MRSSAAGTTELLTGSHTKPPIMPYFSEFHSVVIYILRSQPPDDRPTRSPFLTALPRTLDTRYDSSEKQDQIGFSPNPLETGIYLVGTCTQYRVSQVSWDWVLLTWISSVPLLAQDGGTQKSNSTQPRSQLTWDTLYIFVDIWNNWKNVNLH